VLAAVLHSPNQRLAALLKGRSTVASALVTIAVLTVIVLPFASLVVFVSREAVAGLAYLRDTLGVQSVSELRGAQLPAAAQQTLDKVLAFLHLNRDQVFDAVTHVVGLAQAEMPAIVASGGRAILSTVIMLIALYFLLLDGARMVEWAWRVSPLSAAQTKELTAELRKVTSATVSGILATAIFQGLAASLGYWLARLPHAGFFRLRTPLGSFLPGV